MTINLYSVTYHFSCFVGVIKRPNLRLVALSVVTAKSGKKIHGLWGNEWGTGKRDNENEWTDINNHMISLQTVCVLCTYRNRAALTWICVPACHFFSVHLHLIQIQQAQEKKIENENDQHRTPFTEKFEWSRRYDSAILVPQSTKKNNHWKGSEIWEWVSLVSCWYIHTVPNNWYISARNPMFNVSRYKNAVKKEHYPRMRMFRSQHLSNHILITSFKFVKKSQTSGFEGTFTISFRQTFVLKATKDLLEFRGSLAKWNRMEQDFQDLCECTRYNQYLAYVPIPLLSCCCYDSQANFITRRKNLQYDY